MTDLRSLPDADVLKQLAQQFLRDELSLDAYWQALADVGSAQLDEATLDVDRRRRCGYPEVIFGEGKSVETIVQIARRLREDGQGVLATRISAEAAAALSAAYAGGRYNPVARTWQFPTPGATRTRADVSEPGAGNVEPSRQCTDGARKRPGGRVAVVTAGTSDLPVAEEAAETLVWMGVDALRVQDVGVAGPHRLTRHVPQLRACDAIVVVAGMEGALPSVVGGHVACPVIAVPTSVGYGANFGGIAPLLTMLNSCAANVVVVNIDAGFKAGFVAGMIAQRRAEAQAGSPSEIPA